ncbi:MAG: hypothetical protein LBE17_14550, partial [Treponema sp.]|nr:hypothetical protein [Treponema sp.]
MIVSDQDGGPSGTLADLYLRHATRLMRYSAGEATRLLGILDVANDNIKTLIRRTKTIDTKKQYSRVAGEIKAITQQLNQDLYGQLHLDFEELAAEEIAFVAKSLRTVGLTTELGLEHRSAQ